MSQVEAKVKYKIGVLVKLCGLLPVTRGYALCCHKATPREKNQVMIAFKSRSHFKLTNSGLVQKKIKMDPTSSHLAVGIDRFGCYVVRSFLMGQL